MGRVRTRGDLAALINAGVDNITIKTEICGQGDELMDDEDDNEVVCIVGLDESNRIISLEDPFQTDENSDGEEESYRSDEEELLDESVDNGEERDDAGEERDDAGEERDDAVGEGEAQAHEPGAEDGQNEEGQGGEEGREESPDGKEEESVEEKEETLVEIENEPVVNVKHPDNMYKAVRSVMAGGQDPMKLNPRMKYNRGEDPGFMTGGG